MSEWELVTCHLFLVGKLSDPIKTTSYYSILVNDNDYIEETIEETIEEIEEVRPITPGPRKPQAYSGGSRRTDGKTIVTYETIIIWSIV